jgi:hypothetical protein
MMSSPFRGSVAEESDWRPPAAGFVVAILAFHALWTLLPPMEGATQLWVANVFTDSSVAVALVLVSFVARRYWGSRLGVAWSLIAVGLAFSLFAEVSYSLQDVVIEKEVPFPSIADVGYVGSYVPTLIGLLLMPQAAVSALSRIKLGLDALIVVSALAILSWFLIAEKILAATGEPVLSQAVAIYYPYADLAVVLAAFVLVARVGPGKFALAFSLLGAGFLMTAISDSGYAYLTEAGYESGDYVDIGWVAGYSLLSLAALATLHPTASFEPNARHAELPPSLWRSLVPYAAVVPVAGLLIVRANDGNAGIVLTSWFLALLTLILVRQILANYENIRLNASLRDLTANLELRVSEKTIELMRRSSKDCGDEASTPAARAAGARFEGFPDWPDEVPSRPPSNG